MKWMSFLSIFILMTAFSFVVLPTSVHALSLNDIINSIMSIFTGQPSTSSIQGSAVGGGGGVPVCSFGTVNSTNPLTYRANPSGTITYYTIYADLGSTNNWARIIVKDSSGNTLATQIINQGDSFDFTAQDITVEIINVTALQDGTVVGVNLAVGPIGVVCYYQTTTTTTSDFSFRLYNSGSNSNLGGIAVMPGSSGPITINVTSVSNPAPETVTLSSPGRADGSPLPSGVTYSFSPVSEHPSFDSIMTINVAGYTQPGYYTIKVVGTSSDYVSQQTLFTLEVLSPTITSTTTTTIPPEIVTIGLAGGTCSVATCSLNGAYNNVSIDSNNYVIQGNTDIKTTDTTGTHQFSASNILSNSAGSYQFIGWTILRGIPLSGGPAQSMDYCYSNPCYISINSAPPYYDYFTPEYSPILNLSLTSTSIVNDGSQGVASFIFGFTPGDNYSVNLYSSSGNLLAVLGSGEGGASTLAVTLYYDGTYTGSAYVLAIDTTTGIKSSQVPVSVIAPTITTTISKPPCPYDCCNSDDPNYQYQPCVVACPTWGCDYTTICQDHQCIRQSTTTTTTTTIPPSCTGPIGKCQNDLDCQFAGTPTYTCSPGQVCNFPVAKCYNGNCYSCTTKSPCPYDCCVGDSQYQDKFCPVLQPPCPNGVNCAQQQTCVDHKCVPSGASYTINFKAGWNLFSVPVKNVVAVSSTTCSPASPIFGYSNGNYYQTTYTTGGNGYWVKMNSDCSETLTGTGVTINDFPSLNAGWNLIGAPSTSTSFTDIIGNCNVVSGPFWYNPVSNSYVQSSTLDPDNGYFVKVSADCQLGAGLPPPPPQ